MAIQDGTRDALAAEVAHVRRAIGAGASPETVAACMLGFEFAPFLACVREVWTDAKVGAAAGR